ncbi:hypothetical protein L6P71_28590, partial [Klebsiella pneumoniae]|nr:hypothetical protein [Klebsiella pneumoniae]
NSLNRLIRCVCGKKIGPDPRNFNQRVSLGRNDLLIRTFPRLFGAQIILIALWNLIFTVVLPDEKARTILGFDLYNISSYLLYGMTVLLGIGSVAMLFNKNNS